MENITKLSKQGLIESILMLIKNNQGDVGRLGFILEMLQENKQLYKTDQKYLEKKLGSKIDIAKKLEPIKTEKLIPTIKNIIDSGIGEPGRLHYIINMLQKNKPLYKTDKRYLDEKINLFKRMFSEKIKKEITHPASEEKIIEHEEVRENNITLEKNQIISDLEIELKNSTVKIRQLEQIINEQKNEILILKNKLSNPKLELTSPELIELNKRIKIENNKINEQKIIENKIKEQRIALTQLISYREEYEQKINREKELLENQIRFENQKIAKKDEFVDRLNKKQKELEQLKVEREVILEQIKLETNQIEPELEVLRKELDRLNAEYDTLTKNAKKEKMDLEDKIKDQEQKNKNLKSDKTDQPN